VSEICAKNYQNVIIGFQVTVENVGDAFLTHSVEVLYTVSQKKTVKMVFVITLPNFN